MTIKVGDSLPETTFMTMSAEGPKPTKTAEVFGGKKVALFAVPGAYTPTCHKQHMAGFVEKYDELKKKGFDAIACTAVNDIFVLTHWAKDSKADGKILMLADGSAEFAKKVGLDVDLGPAAWACGPALLDDRRERRGEVAECGAGSRPRRVQRRHDVLAGLSSARARTPGSAYAPGSFWSCCGCTPRRIG